MENRLIKNETEIFFTLKISEKLFLLKTTSYGNGIVERAETTTEERDATKFRKKEMALKIAKQLNATIIKHTQTTTITDCVEVEGE